MGAAGVADCGGDELRKRGREPRDGADRAAREPVGDQRLRPDEDVEPFHEVRLESLERAVRHLQAGKVRRAVAHPLDDGGRDRVARSRGELVEVEGHRGARVRRGDEVGGELPLVERVVRRTDRRHGVRSRLGGVRRQPHRAGRRLRAAVNGNGQPPVDRPEEELGRAHALGEREQDPFSGRAEREESVEPARGEEIDHRCDRVLVEPLPAVAERGHGRCESPPDHGRTLSSGP